MKGLNVTSESFLYIYNDFLNSTPVTQEIVAKTDKWDHIK